MENPTREAAERPPRRFTDASGLKPSEQRVLELLWWRRDMHQHELRGQRYEPLTESEKALLSEFIDYVYDDLADMIDDAEARATKLEAALGRARETLKPFARIAEIERHLKTPPMDSIMVACRLVYEAHTVLLSFSMDEEGSSVARAEVAASSGVKSDSEGGH